MNSSKRATKLYSLVDRAMAQIDRSLSALEADVPRAAGIGYLGQQIQQLSMAVTYMRKEERETAKNPLAADIDADKTPEQIMQEMLDVLDEDDLEMLLEMKRQGTKEDVETSEEMDREGRK